MAKYLVPELIPPSTTQDVVRYILATDCISTVNFSTFDWITALQCWRTCDKKYSFSPVEMAGSRWEIVEEIPVTSNPYYDITNWVGARRFTAE